MNAAPNWAYDALRAMASTRRMTASIDTELWLAARLHGMDHRMLDELQYVRAAAQDLRVRLAAMQVTTQQVLAEVAQSAPREAPANTSR
jgi:hypothetical protein